VRAEVKNAYVSKLSACPEGRLLIGCETAIGMKAGACRGFAKGKQIHYSSDAFTRMELAVVIGSVFTLLLLVLPLLANNSVRSHQTGCLNNLRQIGIAFQAWGNDHDDRRPWFVPMEEGGSRLHPLRNNAFLHYTFLSNYISPALLIDPAETVRTKRMAVNWSSSQGGFLNPGFANNALSYMFSLHTSLPEANDVLSADRNVQFSGVGGCPVAGGTTVQILPRVNFRGWTNGAHGLAGNLLINDGHAEFASQARLEALIARPDDSTPSDHMLTPF
jgi:competence protein ComGC